MRLSLLASSCFICDDIHPQACPHATHPDCQFYRRHHDTIPELETMQPGPRVYTFFLYLSDVEEGGGTRSDARFMILITS